MARTAINPEILSTPSGDQLPLRPNQAAVDSKTWKKGEMGFLTSGEVEPVAGTGKTNVYGIFAKTQATSTSSSTVKFRRLIPGTRLAMYVMTSQTDATAATAEIGVQYGVEAKSNVTYIDTTTTDGQFKVIGPLSVDKPLEDAYLDMDAAPGKIEVEFMGYVS